VRTLSGGLTSHLATFTHTRCKMLRIDCADGTSIGVTDHDRTLNFNLGDGAIDYDPETGILASDLMLTEGFESDNFEVTGPITDDLITRVAVLGGRFNRAVVRLFEVNWALLGSGPIRLTKGNITEARVEGGKFVFEVRSNIDRYNQVVGRVTRPSCDADLGDARCGFALVPVAAEVTAVAGDMAFTVSFSGSYADDYFNLGLVTFTGGELAGTRPMEIFDWTAGGVVTMFAPLAAAPQVGDTLELRRGCPKTRVACRDLFDNVVNFRGFPDMSGSDEVLRMPVPKS
jgi:uncharacterized phage protein (TIGR02218 family)